MLLDLIFQTITKKIYDIIISRIILSYVDFSATCKGLARPLPIDLDQKKNSVITDVISCKLGHPNNVAQLCNRIILK